MQKYRYRAFSLNLASDIPLPELCVCSNDDHTDVEIHVAEQHDNIPSHAIHFNIRGIGRFDMAGGRHIWVCPDSQATLEHIRLFILGSSMGAILHQRGNLVLHGNAIAMDGGCRVFVGPSGNGKSTLAGAFSRRGYQILTDDVCAISFQDGVPFVAPGYPQIKLWEDSAKELGQDPSSLMPIFNRENKYVLPMANHFANTPLEIKQIVVLHTWEHHTVELHTMDGGSKFRAIFDNTYRQHFVRSTGRDEGYFDACSQLANRVPVLSLHRPKYPFLLNQLVDLVTEVEHEA